MMSLRIFARVCFARKQTINRIGRSVFRCLNDSADSGEAISFVQMKKILKQSNISFQEGHACITTDCPLCQSDKRKESKVYVNKTTGNCFY